MRMGLKSPTEVLKSCEIKGLEIFAAGRRARMAPACDVGFHFQPHTRLDAFDGKPLVSPC